MKKTTFAALACVAALCGGPAAAGVIVGDFDPPFGPALPGWSYKGTFTANLPDYVVALGPLVAVPLNQVPLTVSITLFETANPLNQVTQAGIGLEVGLVNINMATGMLVDWTVVGAWPQIDPYPVPLNNWNSFDLDPGPGVLIRSFDFSWSSLTAGPVVNCLNCGGGATASTAGLMVSMAQSSDNGWDKGDVVITFGANGQSTTALFPVPLPGTLALLVPALALLGLRRSGSARRRATAV